MAVYMYKCPQLHMTEETYSIHDPNAPPRTTVCECGQEAKRHYTMAAIHYDGGIDNFRDTTVAEAQREAMAGLDAYNAKTNNLAPRDTWKFQADRKELV